MKSIFIYVVWHVSFFSLLYIFYPLLSIIYFIAYPFICIFTVYRMFTKDMTSLYVSEFINKKIWKKQMDT